MFANSSSLALSVQTLYTLSVMNMKAATYAHWDAPNYYCVSQSNIPGKMYFLFLHTWRLKNIFCYCGNFCGILNVYMHNIMVNDYLFCLSVSWAVHYKKILNACFSALYTATSSFKIILLYSQFGCRSQWSCGAVRRSEAAWLLWSRVWIPLGA